MTTSKKNLLTVGSCYCSEMSSDGCISWGPKSKTNNELGEFYTSQLKSGHPRAVRGKHKDTFCSTGGWFQKSNLFFFMLKSCKPSPPCQQQQKIHRKRHWVTLSAHQYTCKSITCIPNNIWSTSSGLEIMFPLYFGPQPAFHISLVAICKIILMVLIKVFQVFFFLLYLRVRSQTNISGFWKCWTQIYFIVYFTHFCAFLSENTLVMSKKWSNKMSNVAGNVSKQWSEAELWFSRTGCEKSC